METDKFESKKLAIIGGGHIGLALIEGLINSGKITGSQLIVANPSLSKIVHLKKQGVEITSDNKIAVGKVDWIFLAVKPFVVEQVLTEIGSLVKGKVIVSLAAAVTIDDLKRKTEGAKLIRIMPNMAISCNQGVIGLFARKKQDQIKKILSALGLVIEVEREEDLEVITILSGCGPAIVSQFIDILASYGSKNGLSPAASNTLAIQTFKGTIGLLEKSELLPLQLARSVATRGGITEAILNKLQQSAFQNNFTQAMDEGYSKIKELRQKLKE